MDSVQQQVSASGSGRSQQSVQSGQGRKLLGLPASLLRRLEQLEAASSLQDKDHSPGGSQGGHVAGSLGLGSSALHSVSLSTVDESQSSCLEEQAPASGLSSAPVESLPSHSSSSQLPHRARELPPDPHPPHHLPPSADLLHHQSSPHLHRALPHASATRLPSHQQSGRLPSSDAHFSHSAPQRAQASVSGPAAEHALGQVAEASQEGEAGEEDGEGGDADGLEGEELEEPELLGLSDQEQESVHVVGHDVVDEQVSHGHGHQSAQVESDLEFELPPRQRSYEQAPLQREPKGQRAAARAPSEKAECVRCQGRFRASTMRLGGKLCANCFKVHESVARTAEAHGGSFRLIVRRPGSVSLRLSCARGHSWTLDMKSRPAKNWCRRCREEDHAEQQREQLAHLERLREEQRRAQQRLFGESQEDSDEAFSEEEPELPQESAHLQSQRRLLQHVLIDQLLNPAASTADPQLQHQVTEVVLGVDEALFVDFLRRLQDDDPGPSQPSSSAPSSTSPYRELIRRLRLSLHPDQNRCHPRAGDAFARMTMFT